MFDVCLKNKPTIENGATLDGLGIKIKSIIIITANKNATHPITATISMLIKPNYTVAMVA